MNERIRELAQEAGLYVDVNGKPWPRNMNGEDIEGAYQKFAKLIVEACLDRIEQEIEIAYQQDQICTASTLESMALGILDDFDLELNDD